VKTRYLAPVVLASAVGVSAQTVSQTMVVSESAVQTTVVSESAHTAPTLQQAVTYRTVQAVNYEHHNGSTKVDFVGTNLMPSASGHAKVESRRGAMGIGAEFADLAKPTAFGNEYLTYVLWAISPEGRAVNLGEVLVGSNHRSKLSVTTELQSFALIVTAEPYYAVRQPSNAVVLENTARDNTKGTTEAINAKYELMERGGYLPAGYKFDPVVINEKLPLEFFEARNALRIAQSEGASQYAGESYQHAVQLMNTADQYAIGKPIDDHALIAASRQTVQTAEDAREISVKKIDEARSATERQNSVDAQASSQAQANEATRQKEVAQAQADDAIRQKAVAQVDAATAHATMVANEVTSAATISAVQGQAEKDKAALRSRLAEQLNSILQTRDSARGLIISMSDVLFGTGQYVLIPGTREKLAKVAGILVAYPSLSIQVGGYTDNVGSDSMNQRLSENRANSVRTYLVQEGVGASSVTAKGFGNTFPTASNEISSGRQQNRRVELLVSGDAIGSPADVTTGNLRQGDVFDRSQKGAH
jgi:outer membrane protein OmpA-like peptidoglycan-associated protein